MAERTNIKPVVQKIAVSSIEEQINQKYKPEQSTLSSAIDLISGAVLATMSYLRSKQEAKKQERVAAATSATGDYVNKALATLEQTGYDLIDQNIKPGTLEFEMALKKNLYDSIGYQGYCDAVIWAPESENLKGQPNRPIWFTITSAGASVSTLPGLHAPANIENIWYNGCKSIRERWILSYRNKLVREGRLAELSQIQSSSVRINLVYWLILGTVVGGLIFLFVKKKGKRK